MNAVDEAPANLTDGDSLLTQAAHLWLTVCAAPHDIDQRAQAETWALQSEAHMRAWRAAQDVWDLTDRQLPAPVSRWRTWPQYMARRPVRSGVLAIAACLAVAAALPALSLRMTADYRTGTGETRTVTLSDGSTVQLDSDSAIAIGRFGAERPVRLLRGRAYFTVAKDKAHPFTVQADQVKVTVTGTQFDTAIRDGKTDVSLVEGSVRISAPKAEYRLTPGDHFQYARTTGTSTLTRSPVDGLAAWRRGKVLIEDDTISGVAAQIRPYYRGLIWIQGNDLAARRVTGVFDLRDPERALALAVAPHGGRVSHLTPWILRVSTEANTATKK